jgi:hypothetical protein
VVGAGDSEVPLAWPEHAARQYWRNGILFALRRALSGFFIFTGALRFGTDPPHIGLALGSFPTFALPRKSLNRYFATALGFAFGLYAWCGIGNGLPEPISRWYCSLSGAWKALYTILS